MKIGFIGAGQMARALASGIVRAGIVDASSLTISDPSPYARAEFQQEVGEIQIASENHEAIQGQDFLILAVKPQIFESATVSLDLSGEKTTVVSVMGGIRMEQIESQLCTDRIVRVMPNTPCLVNEGACGVAFQSTIESITKEQILKMFGSLGVCIEVPESQLDAVTGLSGSGPAYVFSFIEALADGGVLMGLSREVALKLAAQTVLGAAKMVVESSEHPALLKDRVASPGGTTIFGLRELEAGAMKNTVISAVESATLRSLELGD